MEKRYQGRWNVNMPADFCCLLKREWRCAFYCFWTSFIYWFVLKYLNQMSWYTFK